jgi:hypothetical protein
VNRSVAAAFVLFLVVVLLLPGTARGSAPIAVGKVVAPGAAAVPYGQGNEPTGDNPYTDGSLVYDDQISVELVDYNVAAVTVAITAEEWTPGTVTVYGNQTGANNTTVPITYQETARLDPVWVNATLTALGDGSSASVSLALPYVSSVTPLELKVGSAVWELTTLTPSTDSLAGIFTAGGLDEDLAIEAVVVTAVILGALVAAKRFGKRVYRTPKVPKWWPILWVGVPFGFYFLDYVPTNQALGYLTPFAYPVFIGLAAFPYLPRLWREFDWARFQGIEPKNTVEASSSEAVLPVVKTKNGLCCAPETWREVLYTWMGTPLPQIRGATLSWRGKPIRIQPRGLPVSNPLPAYYESDATAVFWYDATYPIIRVRHRLDWFREVPFTKTTVGPDGKPVTASIPKRRFSPHVVEGWMEGVFPPIQPILEQLAAVHAIETEAHDAEVDRVRIADLLGSLRRGAREAASRSLDTYDQAIYEQTVPRSRAEISNLVKRYDRERRKEPRDADEDRDH